VNGKVGEGGRGRNEGYGKWVELADLPTVHNNNNNYNNNNNNNNTQDDIYSAVYIYGASHIREFTLDHLDFGIDRLDRSSRSLRVELS